MAKKITHFFKRKKDVECGESSAKEGEKDEPSSNHKKLKPYHTAMLKTVQKWETNCELDTANCEFKLKPLAKVCEFLKRLVSSPDTSIKIKISNFYRGILYFVFYSRMLTFHEIMIIDDRYI